MHLPICLNIGKGLVLPLAKLNHYQSSNMFKDARAIYLKMLNHARMHLPICLNSWQRFSFAIGKIKPLPKFEYV